MKMTLQEDTEKQVASTLVSVCTPGLGARHIDQFPNDIDALIILGFASGTTPDRLAPAIKAKVDAGVSVFILSNNPGDPAGPARLKYAAGQKNIDAGAVLLQKINVNHLNDLEKAINQAVIDGKKGPELTAFIKNKYWYQEGEVPPPAEWDTPQGVASLRASTQRAFKRIGLEGSELDQAMHEWEFGKKKD